MPGRKVEEAAVDDLFEHPGHPYTRGLLGSIPNLDVAARSNPRRTRLTEIKGMVPSLANLPAGLQLRAALRASPPTSAAPPIRRCASTGRATSSPAGTPSACWEARA